MTGGVPFIGPDCRDKHGRQDGKAALGGRVVTVEPQGLLHKLILCLTVGRRHRRGDFMFCLRYDAGVDARSFFCHDDTSQILMIQGGVISEPGNMAQRRGFSRSRSQDGSRSTKTGTKAIAPNGSQSEEIPAKLFHQPELRAGVNCGGGTALSCTIFTPRFTRIFPSQSVTVSEAYSHHTAFCGTGVSVHCPHHHRTQRRTGCHMLAWTATVRCCDMQLPVIVYIDSPGWDRACRADFRCAFGPCL